MHYNKEKYRIQKSIVIIAGIFFAGSSEWISQEIKAPFGGERGLGGGSGE